MSEEEKKPRLRYDRALLDEVLKRDGATLVGDGEAYEKLNMDSRIKFICGCGKGGEKGLRCMNMYSGAKCKFCSKKIQIEKAKESFMEKYGCDHPNKNKDFREKTKKTNLEKYGSEYTFQNKEIREKIKKTMNQKYGCDTPTQNKDIMNKVKETNLEKYGSTCSAQGKDIKEKIKKTILKKFGVENSLQSTKVREKYKETMINKYGVEHNFKHGKLREKRKTTFITKYGVEHPAQNPEVMERTQKNAKKYKEFKMPSGAIRKVQGYEPFALTTLLQTYTEDQIKTDRKDVPRVEYEVEGKKRFYFPDIFLPHENKIIEVKSTWTYKCKADNVNQKAEACSEKGYVFEFWVYNAKGERVEVC
jgi:hypothetical protein